MDYLLHILVLVCIYATLTLSLDLLAGHTGLLSIAHAAFFGLGAYTSAILALRFGATFAMGVLMGMAVASVASLVASLPSQRLSDDYFVITTFGFQVIVSSVFNNWVGATRGPLGIPGIPPPTIFGWTFRTPFGFVVLAAALATLAYLVVDRVSTSPFGRVLRAIREDEVFAHSLGKNTHLFKVAVFALSAALAASAGSLYAHYIAYIDPTSFTVTESILVVSMVIIGGAGSRAGPVIGAAVLVILPEALRFIGLPGSAAANLRQIIYGTLLVIMLIVRPRGLVGKYGFGR
jgi:branched-chain amino acid transport system permease protein